jgi:DNA excision repair protein ERCC-2
MFVAWKEMGLLDQIQAVKQIFVETKDISETTLALQCFKKACECGRGGIFLSVARGKVAEGIDFDRHYGRCVIMFGIPFQYTLSRILRARLEYLREKHNLQEGEFLSFDAIRQVSQCVGRVIRSKTDYGIMIFADMRYNRLDKRKKLPGWITQFMTPETLNLSTANAVGMARDFFKSMAQPHNRDDEIGTTMLTAPMVEKLNQKYKQEQASADASANGVVSGSSMMDTGD